MWLTGSLRDDYFDKCISSIQKDLSSHNFKIETQAENFEKKILELKNEIIELKNLIKKGE